jgi:catechol 2,3-dioxygenase-like lactoylglutathione lyase family enzyme
MKRLHVHVGVNDLDQSIRFYSTLFAAEPTVIKDDYAKWMIEDPRVNFAISSGPEQAKGIRHLGIQAESYAKSEKSWVADPDGTVWETFYTDGDATTYGDSPQLGVLADRMGDDQCCLPKEMKAA